MSSKLAFGVEPSTRKYRLRLARYQGLVDTIRGFRELPGLKAPSRERLKLLDVGAGHGRTMQYLKAAGLDGDIDFFGVDNSDERRQRLFEAERWNYQLLDVQQGLPFEDGMFDIIVCEQVLEHLTDPQRVLAEMARVMKPGGMAILGVPTFPPGMAGLRKHLVPRLDRVTGKQRDHEQVFTKSSFVSLIERHPDLEVSRVQAFRCVSGGLLGKLEDFELWYRLSRRVATAVPALAIEVQVVVRRRPLAVPVAPVLAAV